MSRVSKRAGKKALVCIQCARECQGQNSRNVGSFRGRPAAYLRHLKYGHNRKAKPVIA
jgi:hypothetical protein